VKKGAITTNTNEIQRIMREYFGKLYLNTLENLGEIDRFLAVFEQPKLNQEDVNHLNRSETSNEIEAVIVFKEKSRTQ
jgi:hypothetical protein